MSIQSANLIFIPHDPAHLLALAESESAYEKASGLRIAAGLRDFLRAGSDQFITKLHAAADPDPWHFGFAVVHKIDNCMIGFASFTAPPDTDGVVEIAYGIAPDYQGRGYATEAAQALIDFARNDSRVKTIRAHTLAEPNASTHILEKCGFHRAGEAIDEGQVVWRWEKIPPRSTTTS